MTRNQAIGAKQQIASRSTFRCKIWKIKSWKKIDARDIGLKMTRGRNQRLWSLYWLTLERNQSSLRNFWSFKNLKYWAKEVDLDVWNLRNGLKRSECHQRISNGCWIWVQKPKCNLSTWLNNSRTANHKSGKSQERI